MTAPFLRRAKQECFLKKEREKKEDCFLYFVQSQTPRAHDGFQPPQGIRRAGGSLIFFKI
jgi:hypothetical protein